MLNTTTVSESNANITGNALALNITLVKLKWIIDTGATNHILDNHNLLKHDSSIGK